MKKSILFIMGLAMALITNAQPGEQQRGQRMKDPAQIAAHQTDKLKSDLGLSDAQYASVKKINEKYAEKMSSLRKSENAREQKHSEFETLRNQHQQEVNSVLTPEQQQKWKTLREERKEKRKEHHNKNKDHRKQELKTALSLSDSQDKQMQTERESFKLKMKTLHDDKNLNEDDKKSKAKAIKTEHENAIKQILTPDQFTKWKEMRDNKKDFHKSRRKQ